MLRHADPRAANPFESVLRAQCLRVAELHVTPQHVVAGEDFHARVDLADPELGTVVEAEGFENHGTRAAPAERALTSSARSFVAVRRDGRADTARTWERVRGEMQGGCISSLTRCGVHAWGTGLCVPFRQGSRGGCGDGGEGVFALLGDRSMITPPWAQRESSLIC
ncbi:hypothetical protein GCM10023258_08530 [Terrabacter aeriphilus]|uniref:Uncharacterized protein n=1 Tax=Terrabacter aeriphilus TaxID=515662 RepID=A0ABP9J5X9_9MICO